MTSEHAIVVRNLGKEYTLGSGDDAFQYDLLRDRVTSAASALLRRVRTGDGSRSRKPAKLWALKDVDFTVPHGQVVGIIGRNGAGKSTLLKILSRITRPSEGAVDMFGRVGSLLEVGTGFHPELTGRENIFLNGAILGMRRAEIARSFDAIVDFSGVAPFLDTPVKRYSSGMYVRLAFAVAAHLETDILLVDEVLAVGDAEFQRKCLGKIQSVVRTGRTVLFVSHNMAAVKALCERAVWLQGGRLVRDGRTDDVVDGYLGEGAFGVGGRIPSDTPRAGSGEARFRAVTLTTPHSGARQELYMGEPLRLHVELDVTSIVPDAVLEIGISTLDGTRVATMFSVDEGRAPERLSPGQWRLRLDVSAILLPRAYAVDLGLHRVSFGSTVDWVERIAAFTVLGVSRSGSDSYFATQTRGFFRPAAEWSLEQTIAVNSRE